MSSLGDHSGDLSVAMLTTSYPRRAGDMAGRPVHELCRTLVEHGLRVTVLAPHAPGLARREIVDGVKVIRFRYFLPEGFQCLAYGNAGIMSNLHGRILPWFQIFPFLISFLINAFRIAKSVDIIHAHFAPTGFIGVFASRLARKPMILTLRGTGARLLAGRALKWLLHRVDAVVSPHPELTQLANVCGRADVSEIPNPIDVVRFSEETNHRRSHDARNTRPIVTFIGRLVSFKDPETLLRAVPLVLQEHPDTIFDIVGEGPLLGTLKQLAHKFSCESSVRFSGYKSDILPFLNKAVVFVACSRIENIWSNSLVEAMCCELPIVATDAGCTRKELEHLNIGRLVKPGSEEALASALCDLLSHKESLADMGRNARHFVEEKGFSRDTVAKTTLSLYEQVLATRM